MSTKTILAALVGTAVAFLLGWVIFGNLLAEYYNKNTVHFEGLMRGDDTRLYGIAVENLCLSLLFAYVFDRWANFRTFVSGFTGALIIGAPIFAFQDLMMWSTMNLCGIKMIVIDIAVNTVFAGIIGGAIGWVLGTGKKS
ncbi:MAG: hypothetical protein IT223_08870 [Crocinitomicaceae bacterium]|nr:hypothetical protein [Crocinitomicaceae bacterium]